MHFKHNVPDVVRRLPFLFPFENLECMIFKNEQCLSPTNSIEFRDGVS